MDTREIVRSVETRDPNAPNAETLVIAAHIAQMQQWSVRQGLHFHPYQDDSSGSRKKKIDEVLKSNRMDLYYDPIVSLFLCSGSVLWYLRPTGASGYEIHWYRGGEPEEPECQYKAYYKAGGRELDQVIIRYSYEDYSAFNYQMPYLIEGNKRWVRLIVRSDRIIDERHYSQPSLTPEGTGISDFNGVGGAFERNAQANSLGFIPCAVSPNFPIYPGDPGRSEFLWLSNAIENENAMRSAMVDNVFSFSSPTLVTSRPAQQIMEAIDGLDGLNTRPSWSSQKGYGTNSSPSTRKNGAWTREGRYNWPGAGPLSGRGRGGRVAKIIGNVLPDERFGYIFPDPINGDQWRFAQEYREGIHECLGGIDPLGQRAGMSFGEIKSLYGKVAATANKKSRSLWTYGLAAILEMVIYIEEEIFLASYKNYLLNSSQNAKAFQLQVSKGIPIDDSQVLQDYVVGGLVMPEGVSGLAPYGDRTVLWKWAGPVFENSAKEKLDLSIGVRNQQELGVGSLQAMGQMFPEMQPREIEQMLTGVPFRFISSVSGSLGSLLQIQQQLSGIEDPQNPGYPLSLRIDLTQIIQNQVKSLEKEISYGTRFDRANELSDSVPSISPAGLFSAGSTNAGSTNADGTSPTAFTGSSTSNGLPLWGQLGIPATGTAPAIRGLQQRNSVPSNGSPTTRYSAGIGGFSGSTGGDRGLSEWQAPLPSGSTVPAIPNAGNAASYGSYGSYGSSGLPAGIPPDLPPSIIRDLFNSSGYPPVQPGDSSGNSTGNGRKGRKRK